MNKNRTLQKAQEATKFAETAFTSQLENRYTPHLFISKTVSGSMIWEYRENDSNIRERRLIEILV
jgi:hypothetical protein